MIAATHDVSGNLPTYEEPLSEKNGINLNKLKKSKEAKQ